MRQAVIDVRDGDGGSPADDAFMTALVTAGLVDFEVLSCDGCRVVLRVVLEEPLDEERFADLPGVGDLERVDRSPVAVTYVVHYDVSDVPGALGDVDGGTPSVLMVDLDGVSDAGISFELTGSQAAIGDTVADLEAAGADVRLRTLRAYEGRDEPLDTLTDRQRDVLETAHDLGYFDVPRQASLDEVAATLGLDRSTVSEHLQRAERNLFESLL